jgi:hypothetical protein
MEEILKEFTELGQKASYHYADDSTKEWNLGDRAKREALKLFDNNSELQAQMRVIARNFLWSITLERKP